MNCWMILGIEQTSDLAAIKAAYAAKAKEWHPEEHPGEFQQLQQAYRSASRFAKAQKGSAVNPAAAKIAAENQQNAVIYEEAPTVETAEKEEMIQPREIADDIGESAQDYDYGELRQSFDYEFVEEADLNDQFFREFFSIAWNPYLMNNLVCWEYILKRSPYERLLSKTAFRYNFVRTACNLSGWQRKTLLFFEKWLQSCPAADADGAQKKETDLFWWRVRKIGFFGKIVPTQRCVTNEQKVLHDVFLSKVKRCGMDTSLIREADVECYLSFYLPYAAAKQSKMKDLYYGSSQGRTLFSMLLLMVPLIIGMVIYVNVCAVPRQNQKAAREIEQQRIQQQAEEIRKSYEMFQEGDNNSLEWTPEYRQELMQKAVQMQEELLREGESVPESETTADNSTEIKGTGAAGDE